MQIKVGLYNRVKGWFVGGCFISSVESKWKQTVFWEEESLLPGDIVWGTERKYYPKLTYHPVITELIINMLTRMKSPLPLIINSLLSAEANDFQREILYLKGWKDKHKFSHRTVNKSLK